MEGLSRVGRDRVLLPESFVRPCLCRICTFGAPNPPGSLPCHLIRFVICIVRGSLREVKCMGHVQTRNLTLLNSCKGSFASGLLNPDCVVPSQTTGKPPARTPCPSACGMLRDPEQRLISWMRFVRERGSLRQKWAEQKTLSPFLSNTFKYYFFCPIHSTSHVHIKTLAGIL
jgi:hypothetical protein